MNLAENDNQSLYVADKTPTSWEEATATNPFVPTAVQLERADALNRFNRWTIYIPVGLLTTAVFGFFIYLLILAIRPPYEDTRLFLSGVADIILILCMLPVALIFGLLLAGIFGGVTYWRQSGKEEGEPSLQNKYGRLRLLLWKVDQKLSTVYRQADQLMPKIAEPVIRFNAVLAYINSWLAQLRGRIQRNPKRLDVE